MLVLIHHARGPLWSVVLGSKRVLSCASAHREVIPYRRQGFGQKWRAGVAMRVDVRKLRPSAWG
eukprot:5749254-Pleurochrysis_carterae.AAC.5